jgi:tetratricopeptide (TPR) repeat protein
MAIEALDFLARSYFREAIAMVEGFTWGSTTDILSLYGRYEALELSLNPQKDLSMQRSDLNRYLGQAHAMLLESPSTRPAAELQAIFQEAIDHYRAALEGNENDYATQYNLAITLYNEGVRKLKGIGHETSMFELMEIQDGCITLFEQSLPPMQAAHAQQPNRLETLKGLMTLHYALSQKDESDRYRAQIEKILGNR